MILQNKTMRLLVMQAICMSIGTDVLARSVQKEVKNEKTAPDAEDYDTYFSKNGVKSDDLTRQKKADELRLKTIETVNSLIADKKTNKDQKFELYLRLAEIYVERHDYIRTWEIDDFSKRYDKWVKDNQKGKEPTINHDRSRQELTNATNTLRSLTNSYPKHPRIDSVLFELARNMSRLGNDNAVMYFETILKAHPNSSLIPETNLALGEHYFEKHDIPKSLRYYKEAMKFKDHRVYPYAVYKFGWANFNASFKSKQEQDENYAKTVAAFKLTIKLADKADKNNKPLVNLRSEAVKDLVVVWAETEDIDAAWAYFKEIGEANYFYTMLERLGQTYYDNGKTDKAIAVYNRILKEAPTRKSCPQIQEKLVALHDLKGDYPAVASGLQTMVSQYSAGSKWVNANSADQELVKQASKTTETSIHKYGAVYHNQGIKKTRKNAFEDARNLYTLYLKSFESSPNAYEIRYNLADIYFTLGQYDQAATEYHTVSQRKDGKYLKDSAYNAVVAMNKVVDGKTWAQLPPPGEVAEPKSVPEEKKKLVKVIDNYVALLPQEKLSPQLALAASGIFFAYGQYEEAVKRYESLMAAYPASKEAESAIKITVNYYAKRQQYEKIIAIADKYLNSKTVKLGAELQKFLTLSTKSASFNIASKLEKQEKFAEAGKAFADYAKKFPDDDNADRSLHNSAVNYIRASKVDIAATNLRRLVEDYPGSKLKSDALAKLGEIYEGMGEMELAANTFSSMASQFPADSRSPQASFNAAVLYDGLGKTESALANYSLIITKHKNFASYGDVAMKMGELNERSSNYKEAVKYYDMAAASMKGQEENALYAETKAVQMRYLSGDTKNGDKGFYKLKSKLVVNAKLPAFKTRKIIAEYYFNATMPLFKEFLAADVGSDNIEAQIIKKQNILKKLAKNYEDVISVGSAEYLVASLYQLGLAHEDFSIKLFAAEPPKGSSPKEVDAIKSSLEKLAFPLKEESNKYFETAYEKSSELETLSTWSQLAYRKMSAVNPSKYGDAETVATNVGYSSHTMSWNNAVSGLAK